MRNRILFALCVFLAVSCGTNNTSTKDSVSTIETEAAPKRYTVTLEGNYNESAEIIVYEYTKEGERFHQNEFSLKRGESKTFTAQKNAYKVKVYAEMWPWKNVSGWMNLVYILSAEETKEITLNDNTKYFNSEP